MGGKIKELSQRLLTSILCLPVQCN